MQAWLKSALDYVPQWLGFQMRMSEQPGCIVAIAHRGRVVLEQAWGSADLATGEPLTPRHRFRVASHSKSFTAAGILKLRERGRLKLDEPVGPYVEGLHPAVARTTIAQLLSHSAGLIRDGHDAGQFVDRRPFLDGGELMAALGEAPVIEPNSRFKYSNLGYGLLGRVIEAITGDPYAAWIRREIVDAAGLEETVPDMPLDDGVPFARGHTGRLVVGRRLDDSRRLHDQCAGAGGRLPQHRSRSCPLLRAVVARRAQERPVAGQSARDGAKAMARSSFRPRALLWPRHDQRRR